MTLHRLIRRAITAWQLRAARRRVHKTCPEIAAIPPVARDRGGRWQSTAQTRRRAIHDRLRKEVSA